ncbi:MAG: hypothetical protein E7411_05665 [Ruminococcaceae bacterium]|nr:hypothetical protein [Oscillospiraceae bacterium]
MRKYRDKLIELSAVWDKMLSESTARNQEMKKSGAFKNTDNSSVVKQAKEVDSFGNSQRFMFYLLQ